MEVTVVIPVYQAAPFIRAAVDSALLQPEVKEILLVEDGSPDDSYRICMELSQNPRVHVLTHPGHQNLGAAASRNLGIRHAQMPFIAFLDADDTYEDRRFEITKRIFDEHPDADGVHEMIGVYYHPNMSKEDIAKSRLPSRTGISIPAPPERLFRILATGKYGHISPDGLAIRKAVCSPELLFDPALTMSQDSDFILRWAVRRRLYGGDLSLIVAKRGVHGGNSMLTSPDIMYYRRKYLQKCIDNDFFGSKDRIAQLYIISRRVGASKLYAPFRSLGRIALPVKLIGVILYLLMRPKLLLRMMG